MNDEERRAYHRKYEAEHPEKVKEWHRRSYARNKDKVIARTSAYQKLPENRARAQEREREKVARRHEWLDSYKAAHGCHVCGERHPDCLDFHHRDPEDKERHGKQSTISNGVRKWSMERLMAEIEKCDITCANCHRKLHAAMGWEWTHGLAKAGASSTPPQVAQLHLVVEEKATPGRDGVAIKAIQ